MALGTYTPPPSLGPSGKFRPDHNFGKPIILVPREFKPNFVSKGFPNPKDVLIYDVVDLSPTYSGQQAAVIISVITGANAIVDQLREYVPADGAEPQMLPVMFVQKTSQQTGNAYYRVEQLEAGSEPYQRAVAWDGQFGLAYVNHVRDQAFAAAQQQAPVQQTSWQAQAAAPSPQGWAPPAQAASVQQAIAATPGATQWTPPAQAAPAAAAQAPAAQAWQPPAQAPAAPAVTPYQDDAALKQAIAAL